MAMQAPVVEVLDWAPVWAKRLARDQTELASVAAVAQLVPD